MVDLFNIINIMPVVQTRLANYIVLIQVLQRVGITGKSRITGKRQSISKVLTSEYGIHAVIYIQLTPPYSLLKLKTQKVITLWI